MIYLRLHDRLGNILFMIAAALHIDKDVSVFCDNERDLKYVSNMINYLKLPVRIGAPAESVLKRHEYYVPTVYKPILYDGHDLLMDGYFQSYRYFNPKEVIELFKCPVELADRIEAEWGLVLNSRETVSVHVRRGDYLKLPERFPFVGKSYIKKAMDIFKKSETIFIFTSDDIRWCKNNFKGPNIFYSENRDEYYDLFLASRCSHNILSNSTFSYWGGVLNTNRNKRIIAPKRWYGPVLSREANEKNGELLYPEWETVECDWDNVQSCIIAYYKYCRCFWRDIMPFGFVKNR